MVWECYWKEKNKEEGRKKTPPKDIPISLIFALGLIFSQSLPTRTCYELDRLSAKYCKASYPATDTAVTVLSP